jgi:PEP-CTERM motif
VLTATGIGWTLNQAIAINNAGQIVGLGAFNGEDGYDAFLLTPCGACQIVETLPPLPPYVPGLVPEPSTWAMMLLGFASLSFAGYRRARAGRATLAV